MVTLNTTATNQIKNIFKRPIAGANAMQEKRYEEKRKKNMNMGYIYLVLSAVILIAYSILFLYPQLNIYMKASVNLDEINEEIMNYDNVILPSLEEANTLHKSAYEDEYKEVEDALSIVFPEDIDKLGIVSRLENFATSINAKNPPFEFNSMTFGNPEVVNGYTILPISTTISSSKTNFDRFIQLINLSGYIKSEIPIRLMEISNVSIRYKGIDEKTGEDKGVDFTVKLNAFSR
ncbi:hypothetical protein JW758_04865 [Candidatus Peregrinibacteria bacterium]|nr:hypothetical protein [Candidatus Peregrinibacteria bacterium]